MYNTGEFLRHSAGQDSLNQRVKLFQLLWNVFVLILYIVSGTVSSLLRGTLVSCACAVSAPRRDVTGGRVMADVSEVALDTMKTFQSGYEKIDRELSRYPFCIVWTPIPGLT